MRKFENNDLLEEKLIRAPFYIEYLCFVYSSRETQLVPFDRDVIVKLRLPHQGLSFVSLSFRHCGLLGNEVPFPLKVHTLIQVSQLQSLL